MNEDKVIADFMEAAMAKGVDIQEVFKALQMAEQFGGPELFADMLAAVCTELGVEM